MCCGRCSTVRDDDAHAPACGALTGRARSCSIADLKAGLVDKSLPFGVDLLLPQVGGNARKTNTDYTKGQLPELLDVVIESGAKLFVSAVVSARAA
eukprot:4563970-Prymnesium_polylepis.1